MHEAVEGQDRAMLALFLIELANALNLNVNAQRSSDGFTPLHLACYLGHDALISFFVNAVHANLSALDKVRQTFAIRRPHFDASGSTHALGRCDSRRSPCRG